MRLEGRHAETQQIMSCNDIEVSSHLIPALERVLALQADAEAFSDLHFYAHHSARVCEPCSGARANDAAIAGPAQLLVQSAAASRPSQSTGF